MIIATAPEQAQALTDWSNEPSLMQLRQDFDASQMVQKDHVVKIREWRDLLNVTGSAKPNKIRGRSSVQPKLIRRQAEWRYAALTEPFLSSNKMYKVTPTSWEDLDAAQQNELVLNWQFRTKLNPVKFIDEYVRTTVDEGTVIVKLGWMREVKTIEKSVPVYKYMIASEPEELQMIEQGMQIMQTNQNEFLNLPEVIQESVKYTLEYGQPVIAQETGDFENVKEDKVVFNQPTVDMINPENIFIDPTCLGDISKARFIIMSFETSKAELLKDKRYKNLNAVAFESAGILSAPDHETSTPNTFQFKDDLRKRIVAYEYWGLWDIDGSETLVPIVATWVGNTIVRMEENPFPDGKHPFVIVPYLPLKRSMFGETDAELLGDNQRIVGAVTRGMIDMMGRSAASQTGVAKGMLDPTNQKKFDNGQDYQFNPSQNPESNIIQHKFPEIPQSAMLMITMMNQEAEALTGVKAFSGGMSGNAYGDVAAGIRGMLDAASKREMAILRRLAQGMKEIGAKIVMMNQSFLSEEEVVRVTNENFVTVRREDLAGYFDLEVDISTAEVDNTKAQDLGFMLQTIGPDMDIGQRNLILSQIAELKRMPTLAKMLKDYEPKPDPLAEKLKEMEIAKLEAEVEEINSKIRLNDAKAKEASTKSDLNNLDFVEQESGTKHERDIDKQGAQARANKDLEVTKALLKPKKDNESGGSIDAAVGFNELTKGQPEKNFTGRNYGQDDGKTVSRPVDAGGNVNPVVNLNSKYYDPKQDAALNPAMKLT